MQITKDMLEDRLKKLEADMDAVGGAIQDTMYWLQVIDSKEAETQEAEQ